LPHHRRSVSTFGWAEILMAQPRGRSTKIQRGLQEREGVEPKARRILPHASGQDLAIIVRWRRIRKRKSLPLAAGANLHSLARVPRQEQNKNPGAFAPGLFCSNLTG
jgi:hypothetical protein